MKYLAPCRILSTGVTSGQTPIPLSIHQYSVHPFTSVDRGKSMHFDEVWIWAGEFEKTYASFVLAAASGAWQFQEEMQLIACDMARE